MVFLSPCLFCFSEPFNADIRENEEVVKKELKSSSSLKTNSIKKLFSPHPIMWNSNTFSSETFSNFNSCFNFRVVKLIFEKVAFFIFKTLSSFSSLRGLLFVFHLVWNLKRKFNPTEKKKELVDREKKNKRVSTADFYLNLFFLLSSFSYIVTPEKRAFLFKRKLWTRKKSLPKKL